MHIKFKNTRILIAGLVWVIVFTMTHAQLTFSKTYHLEVGSNNRASFFFIEDNSFVVASTHSGDTSVVSALTRFYYNGEIINRNSYSDFVFGNSRSVVRNEGGFEIAGHRWSIDENLTRGLELVSVK